MRRALEEYCIMGVETTIPFHQRILDSHRFMGGQFNTTFVDEQFSLQSPDIDPHDARVAAILTALVVHQRQARRAVQERPGSTSRWHWSRPVGGWPQ
jgi:acetyl-CoA carboxylase biotin carboxylase subunit